MNESILFLLPYPLSHAPSQRFRVEAFFDLLQQEGIGYRTHCFLSAKAWRVLYQKGNHLQKAWAVLLGFLSRLFVVLLVAPRYDFVFIHREAAPLGPPLFEWLLARLLRKKIIYDFDDAIWIPAVSENNRLARWIKCAWKIGAICKWSYRVSAGNEYLADFARRVQHRVTVLPTCVDTQRRYNRLQQQDAERVVIGWTGSHSTLPYLDALVPVLQELSTQYEFDFLVICNQAPAFNLPNLKYVTWKEATEIEDLLRMHIGVMPLQADAWSEGKCGFKIIQYLALGIPAVASPVGVNTTIVAQGENGLLCADPKAWYAALATLLQHLELRAKMGAAGREKIQRSFSIHAHTATFLSLFDRVQAVPEQKQLLPDPVAH